MANFKIRTPFLSAIAFFGTLVAFTIGYSAYVSNYPATATAGVTQLSATEWNKMVTALQTLDTNLSNLVFSSGNVGIGVATPSAKLDVNGTVNATNFTKSNGQRLASQLIAWKPTGSNVTVSGQTSWTGFCPAGSITVSSAGTYKIDTTAGGNGWSCIHASCRLAIDGVLMSTISDPDNWNNITSYSWNYWNIDGFGYATMTAGTHTVQMQCIFNGACTGSVECYRVGAVITWPFN